MKAEISTYINVNGQVNSSDTAAHIPRDIDSILRMVKKALLEGKSVHIKVKS